MNAENDNTTAEYDNVHIAIFVCEEKKSMFFMGFFYDPTINALSNTNISGLLKIEKHQEVYYT